MKKKLTDGLKLEVAGLVLAGILGLEGCASVWQDFDPVVQTIPKWAQPGGYVDWKEEQKREKNLESLRFGSMVYYMGGVYMVTSVHYLPGRVEVGLQKDGNSYLVDRNVLIPVK